MFNKQMQCKLKYLEENFREREIQKKIKKYFECESDFEVLDKFDNFDEYDQEDMQINFNIDEKTVNVDSREKIFIKRRVENYSHLNDALCDTYGETYQTYRDVYLLRPLLAKRGKRKDWVCVYLFLFINGDVIIKFEVPFLENNSKSIVDNNMLNDYEFIMRSSKNKKHTFESLSKVILWYKDNLLKKKGIVLGRFDSIIIANYSPCIENINNIKYGMKEKIYRMVAAPVPQTPNFDFKEEINKFWTTTGYSYSGMKNFCKTTGYCFSIPDKKYIKAYKDKADWNIANQIDINIEFSVIILLLKYMAKRKLVLGLTKKREISKSVSSSKKEYNRSRIMICEMMEKCYGSVIDQVKYMESNMPYYFKDDMWKEKMKAMEQLVVGEKDNQREKIQRIINVGAFFVAFVCGLPSIRQTIQILILLIGKIFNYSIATDIITYFSVGIWILLMIIIICFIRKKK